MAHALLSWARSLLYSKRKIVVNSFDDLKDGNVLLHLWELVAPELTLNYVHGHELYGQSIASKNIPLLANLPSSLRIPATEIGEGSGSRILEVIACWQVGRALNYKWNITEKKPISSLVPRISKCVLDAVKGDLEDSIPSVLTLFVVLFFHIVFGLTNYKID